MLEGELAVGHAHTRFDENGSLNDPNLAEQLDEVVQTVVAELAPLSEQRAAA